MPKVRRVKSKKTGKYIPGRWTFDGRRWGLGRPRINAASKVDAQELADTMVGDVERQRSGLVPRILNPNGWTLGDLVTWELDHGMPPRSRKGARGFLRPRVLEVPALATLPLEHVTTDKLLEYRAALIAGGLKPRSVNKLRTLLSAAFNRARDQRLWLGANPAAAIPKLTEEHAAVSVLTVEETLGVCDWWWKTGALRGRWKGPFLALGGLGGLRKGEILPLLTPDLARQPLPGRKIGRVLVTKSLTYDTTKSGKPRSVPIFGVLEPWIERALSLPRTSDLVFESRKSKAKPGQMLGVDVDPSQWLRKALGALGVKKRVTFHQLRHTACTLWLEAGMSPPVVEQLLGHVDEKMRRIIYAHVHAGWVEREAEKFGEAPVRVVDPKEGAA